jgi:hypothetical protein
MTRPVITVLNQTNVTVQGVVNYGGKGMFVVWAVWVVMIGVIM